MNDILQDNSIEVSDIIRNLKNYNSKENIIRYIAEYKNTMLKYVDIKKNIKCIEHSPEFINNEAELNSLKKELLDIEDRFRLNPYVYEFNDKFLCKKIINNNGEIEDSEGYKDIIDYKEELSKLIAKNSDGSNNKQIKDLYIKHEIPNITINKDVAKKSIFDTYDSITDEDIILSDIEEKKRIEEENAKKLQNQAIKLENVQNNKKFNEIRDSKEYKLKVMQMSVINSIEKEKIRMTGINNMGLNDPKKYTPPKNVVKVEQPIIVEEKQEYKMLNKFFLKK